MTILSSDEPARIGLLWPDRGDYDSGLVPLIIERELRRRLPSATISFYSPDGWARSKAARGSAIAEPLGPLDACRAAELSATLDVMIVAGEIDRTNLSLLEPVPGLPAAWSAIAVSCDIEAGDRPSPLTAPEELVYLTVRDELSKSRLCRAEICPPIDVVPDTRLLVADLFSAAVLERRRRQLSAVGDYPRDGRPLVIDAKAAADLAAAREVVVIAECGADDDVARALQSRSPGTVHVVDSSATVTDVVAAVAFARAFRGSSPALWATARALDVPVETAPATTEDGAGGVAAPLARLSLHFDRLAAVAESCAAHRSSADPGDRQRRAIAALTARNEALHQALQALRERAACQRAIFAEAVNRFAEGELLPARLVEDNAALLRAWSDTRHGAILAAQRRDLAEAQVAALEAKLGAATAEIIQLWDLLADAQRQLGATSGVLAAGPSPLGRLARAARRLLAGRGR